MTETAAEFIARKDAQWTRERERGKAIKTKDIGRKGKHLWAREAWTLHVQHNYREKVFVIERMRYVGRTGRRAFKGGAQPDDIEYRFGYFIVGRIRRAAGRWWWAQFSPLIPHQDLKALLTKARANRTLLTRRVAKRNAARASR
jgi:hypothetical protein